MSEEMELWGCMACGGERKNWCPIHGDGSEAPLGDMDAALGILIANRDKYELCPMCGAKPIPTICGWYCSNAECGYQVGSSLDFVMAVNEELGPDKVENAPELHAVCDAVARVAAKRWLAERDSSQLTKR